MTQTELRPTTWIKHVLYLALFLATAVSTAGCKPKVINIAQPQPSQWQYLVKQPTIALGIIDARKDEDKALATGAIESKLVIDSQPLEPFRYLKSAVSAELDARGFRPRIHSQAPIKFYVSQFTLHTERGGPYAPFVVWAAIKGELTIDDTRHPIRALVVDQHYPKFTYSELDQPLYSESLERLVREISSKIAHLIDANAAVGNLTVEKAGQSIERSSLEPELVYELAFSNNQTAITYLVELLQSNRAPVRYAAIYGLGILRADAYVPTLTAFFTEADNPIEKAMLLKSILEMDRPQTNRWVSEQMAKIQDPETQDPLGLLVRTSALYDLDQN